ncbi:hypothetical protein M422DRAFT_264754 [Sphaerobolus stellatus SS14]|uniref:Retrotransposon gag domain-containing protein n=1 Tax=Sphaerobolus stellatus (strain SS14) TaxID=990650 RepID=A0A0C9UVQ0_SPHS4|nr:hypothetical protein M422DRAFT_264754 [Sphaerobolus stellatus SS14]
MPPSGYLAQRFRNPGDPSSSSPSSSSSSGSSHAATKKKKYKARVKRRLSEATSVKISSPKPYDGSANFDEFERWTFDVTNWFDITKFPRKLRVRYMSAFLTGKAAKFYFAHVAPNTKLYTVKSLGKELFDYCFPSRFRQMMCERFYESTQGRRPIRDYIHHLRSLASRVPELNDFSMIQQLVKSAAPYLQIKWAEAGFSQDFTSLHEYEEAGYHFEQAEEVRIFLERRLSKEQTLRPMRNIPQHTTPRREEYPRPSMSYQPRNNPNRQFRQ